ncbi:MAG: hypothetical protein JSW65_01615 [Candidatus Bipolaricaulota bacterium]|nr:MAG: hypothetical protein JSW65_01615 [Candidatus Bipolaricaulota bacterium]
MRRMVVLFVVAALIGGVMLGATAQEDAWIPGLASFLLPGLGQLLNDEIDKAILHFLVDLAIGVGGSFAVRYVPVPWYTRTTIVAAAHLAWAIYSGLDAYNTAKDTGFTLGWGEDGLTLGYAMRF